MKRESLLWLFFLCLQNKVKFSINTSTYSHRPLGHKSRSYTLTTNIVALVDLGEVPKLVLTHLGRDCHSGLILGPLQLNGDWEAEPFSFDIVRKIKELDEVELCHFRGSYLVVVAPDHGPLSLDSDLAQKVISIVAEMPSDQPDEIVFWEGVYSDDDSPGWFMVSRLLETIGSR